ncbi:MAG: ATP-binding cassette domain-containing protein [Lachnospiraceae bacterium]|nr:ATP-binding cassette domain-containing protein [Lachnospiraceae bacterium]
MISIKNLKFAYADKMVMDGFDLTIHSEGLTALSGPSGCGKTTLLRILAGLEMPDGGSVDGITPEQTAILFQEDRLLPWRTVREHILDVLPRERCCEVRDWLSFAELEKEGDLYPKDLSGGMARRLAFARCCAYGGELLLLDEPFTGVDRERRSRLLKRLKKLRVTALIATHEQDVVDACEQVIRLDGPPLRKI